MMVPRPAARGIAGTSAAWIAAGVRGRCAGRPHRRGLVGLRRHRRAVGRQGPAADRDRRRPARMGGRRAGCRRRAGQRARPTNARAAPDGRRAGRAGGGAVAGRRRFAMFTGHLAALFAGPPGDLRVAGGGAASPRPSWSRAGTGARVDGRKRRARRSRPASSVALGAELANRTVLPRLYLWFHQTLAAVTLVAAIAAARLVWRRPRPVAGGRSGRGRARRGFAAVAGLRSSQVLRYAASETDGAGVRGAAGRAVAGARHGARLGDAGRARDGRAAAAARRAAPPGGRRPGDHDRRAAGRSRGRLRLHAPDDAQPRRAGARGCPVHARLLAGAAHVVLCFVDADVEVLPDHGAPRARRAARHGCRRPAPVRLEDGRLLSAGGVLHRLRAS